MIRHLCILIASASLISGCLTPDLGAVDGGSQTSSVLSITAPAAGFEDMNGVVLEGLCVSSWQNVVISGTGAAAPVTADCENGLFSASVDFSSGAGSKEIVVSQNSVSGSSKTASRLFKRDSGSREMNVSGALSQAEGSNFVLTATLVKASPIAVSIEYHSENDESLPFQSRAEAVGDYSQVRGKLEFAAGETVKTISIPTVSSLEGESDEQFKLIFDNASNISMSENSKTLTITDSADPIFGADVDRIMADAGPSSMPSYHFPQALQSVYVDAASGSDSFSGNSESLAKASIGAAVAIAQPGTHIIVKNGTYREQVNVGASGTAANPIVIKAASGHSPVVAGSEVLTGVQLLADAPSEATDIFTNGFEEASLSSSLSLSNPTGDGGSAGALNATSSEAAHGSQSYAFTFPAASSTNKGSHLIRAFGTPRASGKSILYVRAYFALNSTFAMANGTRMDVAVMAGLNASDVTTNHYRLAMRKDGANNRYYIDVINSAGASMGDSRTLSAYLTPGAGYASLEMGFDNTNAAAPLKFYMNGAELTLANQPVITSCIVNTVRLGAVHNSSGTVGYPDANSKIHMDSLRMASAQVGAYTQSWPPNSFAADGFESNLNGFTEVEASSNDVAISSAQAKRGSQSAVFNFAGSGAQLALTQAIASKEDIYVRFYVYLENFALHNSNTSAGTNTYRYNLLTLSEGSTPRVILGLTKAPQGLKLDARIMTPDVTNISNYYKGFPGEIKTGAWYQIEVRYKGNDAVTGGGELWLNAESIAGNYDRVANPDVYAGLNTTGMKIDTISLGDASTGQAYSSNTRPVAGSKMYIDEYRLSVGAPAGLIPNGEDIRIYEAPYSASLYTGMEYSEPGVMIQTDATRPEGKTLMRLDQKRTVSAGSFAAESGRLYFRPIGDELIAGKTMEFGVRDVGFMVDAKDYVAIQGFNVRGANHGNHGAIFLRNGSQHNWILKNLIQGNAGAGLRIEGELNAGETALVKAADHNTVAGNHFRDNIITFGSGMRIDNSGHLLIEHNLFESQLGTNISTDCISHTACTQYRIRRNIFTSAGESNMYLSKYSSFSEIYANHVYGARGSSYRTMRDGIRASSGGSGVHIARAAHDHVVFNNLIYDTEGGGVTLRAKVWNSRVFNNTIAKIAGKGVGTAIDLAKDNNEEYLPDNNGNGILDGLEELEDNAIFNNFLGLTPGSTRCVDIEGYDEDQSAAPVKVDLTNKSDYNLFHKCGRIAIFNSTTYVDATFSNYVADTLTYSGLQRDSHSIVIPSGTTLYVDADANDFRPLTQTAGACRLGVNCPWNP